MVNLKLVIANFSVEFAAAPEVPCIFVATKVKY